MKIVEGDITKVEIDVIVNAANSALSGGGGVDGAIHRAAGPELLAYCRKLGRCMSGNVVTSPGFALPAKYIFHAVGPVWRGGEFGEAEDLSSCYRKSLSLAHEYEVSSIAFPAISCGAYKYPIEKAAKIAIESVMDQLDQNDWAIDVSIVCFDLKVKKSFDKALENYIDAHKKKYQNN